MRQRRYHLPVSECNPEVTCMGQDARKTALMVKHAEIETVLTEEERRPFPDFKAIQELKKRKLMVKDELKRASVHH